MTHAPPPADRLDCYEVGGAVRDALLGRPVHDRDWVVVGATPAQMEALGFRPVGRDFPVFLHPKTNEEFALARTERKEGRGYRGFVVQCAPEVTLEEDLRRRDLTVNAIARGPDGRLIDPYGGERDLRAGWLRHVSEAFAEDPVRILRTARFAARFNGFRVAPETQQLMQAMVAAGEVDALVPERVWQELARGLGEAEPSLMIQVLRDCGALARVVPELDAALTSSGLAALDTASAAGETLPVRFALLVSPGGREETSTAAVERVQRIAQRLKAPNDCRDLAVLCAREHAALDPQAVAPDAAEVLALIERCDALRKPERLEAALRVAAWRVASPGEPAAPSARLHVALAAARGLDAGAIARRLSAHGEAAQIIEAVRSARLDAVRRALSGS